MEKEIDLRVTNTLKKDAWSNTMNHTFKVDIPEAALGDVSNCGSLSLPVLDRSPGNGNVTIIHHDGRYWREVITEERGYRQNILLSRGSPFRMIDNEFIGNVSNVTQTADSTPLREDVVRVQAALEARRQDSLMIDGKRLFHPCGEPVWAVRLHEVRSGVSVQPSFMAKTADADVAYFPLDRLTDATEFAAVLSVAHGCQRPVAVEGSTDNFQPIAESTVDVVHVAGQRLRDMIDRCAPHLLGAGLDEDTTRKLLDFRSDIRPTSLTTMFDAEELCAGLAKNNDKPEIATFLRQASVMRQYNAFYSNQPVADIGLKR